MLALTMFISCDEGGDLDIGGTATQDMAGDWYVEFLVDGQDIYGLGYSLLSTYNTAANKNTEMWIDDHENTWAYKLKTSVDYANKTFSGTDLENQVYDITATINDGKILKDAATTSGGNVSDSIYFEIEFSDQPGTIYQVTGYKRTGFPEDEH